ncbi:MAG TPA: calcium-binding protein [Jiangellaceae bacterium]
MSRRCYAVLAFKEGTDMSAGDSRGSLRLRVTVIGLLVLVLAGIVVTPGMAAPTGSCFGMTATIAGSGLIVGTAGNDVIVGSAADDSIDGRAGNDLICGLGGNDRLVGGVGNDQVHGDANDDLVVGDVLAETGDAAGSGNDRLFGDDGADNLTGDSRTQFGNAMGGGNDQIFGGDGDDERMHGDSITLGGGDATGGGNDYMEGGDGDDGPIGDSVAPFEGTATGAGNDVILGGPGRFDFLIGDSEGTAAANGNGGHDLLDMGADGGIVAIGDHNINAPDGGRANGAGNDRIIGGDSDFEFLIGDSSPADFSVTFAGNDSISGRGGDDTIFGDNANFNLDASAGTAGGNDSLDAGAGADTVRAGPRNDFLNGGPGSPDDCDGEAGRDAASGCEILAGIP